MPFTSSARFSRSHRPDDPGYSVDVPTHWRDCSTLTELWFYAAAIKEMGEPLVFSLHLLDLTKTMMVRSGLKPLEFIGKRFRDQLPGVPYCFSLERTRDGTLHVHGLLSAKGTDQQHIEAQLGKIAGDRRKAVKRGLMAQVRFHDQRAVDCQPIDQNKNFGGRNGIFGSATYAAKHAQRMGRRLGSSPIGRSLDVSKRARAIFDEVVNHNGLPLGGPVDAVSTAKS